MDIDTNELEPIPPSTETELANTDVSFEKSFCELTSMGYWPLSMVACLFAVVIFVGIPCAFFLGLLSIGGLISIGLVSGVISILTWTTLSWFNFSLRLKAIFSIWSPAIVSLIAVNASFPIRSTVDPSSVGFLFVLFIIPATIGAIPAIAPYLYGEHLKLIQNHRKLIESNDDGQQI